MVQQEKLMGGSDGISLLVIKKLENRIVEPHMILFLKVDGIGKERESGRHGERSCAPNNKHFEGIIYGRTG